MQAMQWPVEPVSELYYDDNRCATDGDLWRAAHGETSIVDAFHTFDRCVEEHARTGADLLEREIWATNVLLQASSGMWERLPSPTLRFNVTRGAALAAFHLELGRFAHLAALATPSEEERALIAAREPCWARVSPHQDRQCAGQKGPLTCAYVPISTAEAVATVGFAKILAQIEAAARIAGQVLLAEAQAQRDRRQRLLQVERMLGWDPEPDATPALPSAPRGSRVLLALLGRDGHPWLSLSLAILGLIVAMLCFFIAIPHVLLALLVVAPGLLIWKLAV